MWNASCALLLLLLWPKEGWSMAKDATLSRDLVSSLCPKGPNRNVVCRMSYVVLCCRMSSYVVWRMSSDRTGTWHIADWSTSNWSPRGRSTSNWSPRGMPRDKNWHMSHVISWLVLVASTATCQILLKKATSRPFCKKVPSLLRTTIRTRIHI